MNTIFFKTNFFFYILTAPQYISVTIYLSIPLVILAIGIILTIFVIYYFYQFKPYVGEAFIASQRKKVAPINSDGMKNAAGSKF